MARRRVKKKGLIGVATRGGVECFSFGLSYVITRAYNCLVTCKQFFLDNMYR